MHAYIFMLIVLLLIFSVLTLSTQKQLKSRTSTITLLGKMTKFMNEFMTKLTGYKITIAKPAKRLVTQTS